MADIYLKSHLPVHLHEFFEPAEIGLESTPHAYVAKLVDVFREVRRVLRDDGTLWLNLGDSYAANGVATLGRNDAGRNFTGGGGNKECSGNPGIQGSHKRDVGLKPKDLLGIPWRVAFALQADGWYLRQDIIWAKPNPMPESVTDRCTKSHEYIFLLSKSANYHYDHEAVKEASVDLDGSQKRYESAFWENGKHQSGGYSSNGAKHTAGMKEFDGMRNKRSVWTVASEPYSGAHFATFPTALIEPCILAGAPVGAVVFDPFLGSGTTAQVAQDLGRQWIGCELNPAYAQMQRERVAQTSFLLEAA